MQVFLFIKTDSIDETKSGLKANLELKRGIFQETKKKLDYKQELQCKLIEKHNNVGEINQSPLLKGFEINKRHSGSSAYKNGKLFV